ncbi:hypothetical protein ACFLY7_00735 [Patescibacteria group bacterium]
MQSIRDFGEKINYFKVKLKDSSILGKKDDIFIILLIILVAIISFGLGKLSQIEQMRGELKIKYLESGEVGLDNLSNKTKQLSQLVASKKGSKYFLPWCSSAQTIKENNKVWFSSKEEAEGKGYTPAKNCKGI